MTKFAQGLYMPKYPAKYIGKGSIHYRSSWELHFWKFCDEHPSVISWAVESIKIPYRNPLTGKQSIYIPDVLIVYQDITGKQHVELIEIKPSTQITMEAAKSRYDKLMVAKNFSKWQAATQFCQMQGIKFRIVSERELFKYGSKR